MAVLLKQGQPCAPDETEAFNGCVDNHPSAVYVYRCNGGVDEFADANIVLRPTKILIVQGGNIVATYDRAKVFMATETPIAPPILF